MVHHRLVGHLADEQFHVDPPLRGGGDRAHQRLVRHEVRTGDAHPSLRLVEQRVEQPQVVLGVEARTARHHLAVEVAGAAPDLAGAGATSWSG